MMDWEEEPSYFVEWKQTEEMLFSLCKKVDLKIIQEDEKLYKFWLEKSEIEKRNQEYLKRVAKEQEAKQNLLAKLSKEEKRLLGIIE